MHLHLLAAFDHQLRSRAERLALISWENERLRQRSWRELATLVQAAAAQLEDRFASSPGLPKRIGYRSDNSIDDVVLTLAAARVGALLVPISRWAAPADQHACWERVGGHWIHDEFVARLPAAKLDHDALDHDT
ncbi:MAG: hypothetical protein ACF788_05390, partial [Novipirellula sp. JB048]